MKKIWLGSSWKMNKTSAEVAAFCETIQPILEETPDAIQTFLIPPFPYVREVAEKLSKYGTRIGVQNICWAKEGAFTGEVSADMAKDIGATIVEIGHSERRAMFNETDATVNKKVRASLLAGLKPLICVGDSADEKRWGVSAESIVRQVKIALFGISREELKNVIIAYEPVWAIGESGVPASPHEAEDGLKAIKEALIDMYGREDAQQIVLLYGGSVHQDNAAELIQQPSIDGLFVGRAAWNAQGYAALLSIVESYCK
ncbi:triose-phosphate isomerase [Vibrio sp. JC009]|uniref:triose-phosphate isomerase n=1 Tax=Vibrio sp. JC009 TaxID=2912314 RepID=UPI0023B19FE1|nr:triose-phosphate isomerase [Vibrio sp. JC009]WED24762.1 triose-phosphate isomerase [Vibrio sp. JC009]